MSLVDFKDLNKKQPEVVNMNTEQQFVDLIKEGKVADAMQLIKSSLTEMAGSKLVDSKFEIAEKFGMKKKEDDSEEKEDDKSDDDSEEKEDDDDVKKTKNPKSKK
jgi:hypothetical protein